MLLQSGVFRSLESVDFLFSFIGFEISPPMQSNLIWPGPSGPTAKSGPGFLWAAPFFSAKSSRPPPAAQKEKEEIPLTMRQRAVILGKQNKEGWLHPPHLPLLAKRFTTFFRKLLFQRFAVVARVPLWFPRFVIFRMEVL